jgi:hypothetical protein
MFVAGFMIMNPHAVDVGEPRVFRMDDEFETVSPTDITGPGK